MRRYTLLVLLTIVLISCGAASDSTQTPEAIHARWIAALRTNDRATALTLVGADRPGRALFVDQTLHTMQDLMTSPSSPSGPLQGIDLQAPTNQGQGNARSASGASRGRPGVIRPTSPRVVRAGRW